MPAVSVFSCFQSTSNLTRIAKIDRLGIVNGTLSHCQLKYCAKRYRGVTVKNTVVSYESVEEESLQLTSDAAIKTQYGWDYTFKAKGMEETFSTDDFSRIWLTAAMSRAARSYQVQAMQPLSTIQVWLLGQTFSFVFDELGWHSLWHCLCIPHSFFC
jgi:hypothetical protein